MTHGGEPVWGLCAGSEAESLLSAAARCAPILEHLREGVYLLKGERMVFVNREFAEMLGYSREELTDGEFDIGRLVAPESRAVVEERREGRVAGKDLPVEYEFLALRKDGSRLCVSVRNEIVPDPDEVVVLGAVRDVTELRAVQAELARRERLIESVAGVFRDALVCEDEAEVARRCLSAAVESTGSGLGLVGEVADGRLKALAFTDTAGDATGPDPDDAGARIRGLELRGVWAPVDAAGTSKSRMRRSGQVIDFPRLPCNTCPISWRGGGFLPKALPATPSM